MEPDRMDDQLARLARLTEGLAPPPGLAPRVLEALARRALAPPSFWELALASLRLLLAPSVIVAAAAVGVAAWEQARLDAAVADATEASTWSSEP